ncbi:Hypothetical predicted protein, partial [Pelobates cultripes]
SVGSFTNHLRTAGMGCRWGMPRTLTVIKNGVKHKLTSLNDGPAFLRALGLPPLPAASTETPKQHVWDPSRTVLLSSYLNHALTERTL